MIDFSLIKVVYCRNFLLLLFLTVLQAFAANLLPAISINITPQSDLNNNKIGDRNQYSSSKIKTPILVAADLPVLSEWDIINWITPTRYISLGNNELPNSKGAMGNNKQR